MEIHGPAYRPFSNGTQFMDWQERNCIRCRFYDRDKFTGECEIDGALGAALFGDGAVPELIAGQMGYLDHKDEYTWDCPARQLR